MKKNMIFGLLIILFGVLAAACNFSAGTTDQAIESTRVALAIQQTSFFIDQTSEANLDQPGSTPTAEVQPTFTNYPTFTKEPLQTPTTEPQTTTAPPTPTATQTQTQSTSELIQKVSVDRKTFYCVPSDGPTTLTITVEMSDVNQGLAIWWRLSEKSPGKTTDWEYKALNRAGGNNLSFTFDADVWTGTNNFYYPPLMGESWFQFQIIANDNSERTEVFSDVTFFPCAQ